MVWPQSGEATACGLAPSMEALPACNASLLQACVQHLLTYNLKNHLIPLTVQPVFLRHSRKVQ
jgi:hypothetical protein